MRDYELGIGVDFGTANSYFAESRLSLTDPFSWDSSGNPVLETAICYGKNGHIVSIGQKAVEDWGNAEPDEELFLKYWFKPEISEDEEAEKAATDFINQAIAIQKADQRTLFPSGARIIVGAPADTSHAFRAALTRCFQNAGVEQSLEIVHEPVGALIALLHQERIDLSFISKGILVVDMGAGTCDFALIRGLEVNVSWGDPCLGGRLFDDLFYQIFLKSHPDAEHLRRLSARDRFYLHYSICREEKELFSDEIRKQTENGTPNDTARFYSRPRKLKALGAKGSLDISFSEFLAAAREYRPSELMCSLFSEKAAFHRRLRSMQTTGEDLIEWFRRLLKTNDYYRGVERVILAGGSSKLPFVPQIIREEMGQNVTILPLPMEPYALISEGLAQLPGFRGKCLRLEAQLKGSKAGFVSEKKGLVREKSEVWAKNAMSELVTLLGEKILDPILRDAHKNEIDSQQKLQDALKKAYDGRDAEYREREHTVFKLNFLDKIEELLNDCAQDWLKEHARGFEPVLHGRPMVSGRFSVDRPVSSTDITGMGLGTALLGGLGFIHILETFGWVMFDPTMTLWIVAVPAALILFFFGRLPFVARWQFRRFTKAMEDREKREKVVKKASEKAAKSMLNTLLAGDPKGLTKWAKQGFGDSTIEELLADGVADAIIQQVHVLTKL